MMPEMMDVLLSSRDSSGETARETASPSWQTWMTYELWGNLDRSLTAYIATNDDDDDNVPDPETQSWVEHYVDWKSAQQCVGVSRTGFAGKKVDVYLYGVLVTHPEQYDPCWVPPLEHPLYRGVV